MSVVSNKLNHAPEQISKISKLLGFKTDIIWFHVFFLTFLHIFAIYGCYLCVVVASWNTVLWSYLLIEISGIGITAGTHRLWSHRAYKAKLPLRIILMIAQTLAFQKTIYGWTRDHRSHHKYTDTDADPHNFERGYFFSHIGWIMMKKHKEVLIKGKGIDLSDLEADPVVMFQNKYFLRLVILTSLVFPAVVPWYFWQENLWVCWFTPTFFRHVCRLHVTLLINSAAHAYGTRPYDKTISPADNAYLSFLMCGEGWHNYHHVFPWDYKTGELGGYMFNSTTLVIDLFSKIGWAYDLKVASVDMITSRRKRTGNSKTSYSFKQKDDCYGHQDYHNGVWGWGDKDMEADQAEKIKIFNKFQDSS